MYVIICEELRNKYDFFLWNERKGNQFLSGDNMREMLEEIDELQERFSLSDDVKLLLFDLAEKGQAITDNQVRVKIVEEVLEEAEYSYETKRIL
jgi:hypothetical protein